MDIERVKALHAMYYQKYLVYQEYNKNWVQIAQRIPNRSAQQVRSHAQKILTRHVRKQQEKKLREEVLRRIQTENNHRITRSTNKKDSNSFMKKQESHLPKYQKLKKKGKDSQKKDKTVSYCKQARNKAGSKQMEIVKSQSNIGKNTSNDHQNQGSTNVFLPQFSPPRESVQSLSFLSQIFFPSITTECLFPLFADNNFLAHQNKAELLEDKNQKFRTSFIKVNRNITAKQNESINFLKGNQTVKNEMQSFHKMNNTQNSHYLHEKSSVHPTTRRKYRKTVHKLEQHQN